MERWQAPGMAQGNDGGLPRAGWKRAPVLAGRSFCCLLQQMAVYKTCSAVRQQPAVVALLPISNSKQHQEPRETALLPAETTAKPQRKIQRQSQDRAESRREIGPYHRQPKQTRNQQHQP